MNKRGKVILGITIAFLAIITIAFIVCNRNYKENDISNSNSNIISNTKVKDEITIRFNSDGGTTINDIKIKKSSSITLPITNKEGYNFLGWYLNDKEVNNETKFESNVTLVAHWDKIPDNVKTFTIKFDTDGGNKINDIKVECGKEFKSPINPVKNGYKFVNWVDKNEKVILDGTKFTCEDVTLKARWEKVNGQSNSNNTSKEESNKTSNTEVKKEYTCNEGTLDGNKCVISTESKTKCAAGQFEYEGKCVTVSAKASVAPIRKCGSKIINLGGGSTPSVEGTLLGKSSAYYACYYKEVLDSYEQSEMINCTTRGHKWSDFNNKCYYDSDGPGVNISYSCASNAYIYISNPNQFNGVNGMNGGCFPISTKVNYCDSGYTLSGTKCIKIVDAKLK